MYIYGFLSNFEYFLLMMVNIWELVFYVNFWYLYVYVICCKWYIVKDIYDVLKLYYIFKFGFEYFKCYDIFCLIVSMI